MNDKHDDRLEHVVIIMLSVMLGALITAAALSECGQPVPHPSAEVTGP